jgi:hypothetical protein
VTEADAHELGIAIVLMPLGMQIPQALKKVAEFADRYINVKIVMDHIGFPRPESLPKTFGLTPEHSALAADKNVDYKFTGFLITEMEAGATAAGKPMVELKPFLHYMVGVFGADHFVWGTDYGNVEGDDIEINRQVEVRRGRGGRRANGGRHKKTLPQQQPGFPRSIRTGPYKPDNWFCRKPGGGFVPEKVSLLKPCYPSPAHSTRRNAGYPVKLVFLSRSRAELAIARVSSRAV